MISKKMEAALNDQIREETYSAYLYWSMAAWFEAENLRGFANWMRVQTQEEMVHAIKFYTFILDRGGGVKLQALAAPANKWDSPLAAFQAAYKHEQHITGRINELTALARKENDNAALIMLEWFVNEQVEEEKNADEKVKTLKLVGDNGHAILMLDREAATRVFVPPAAAGGPAAGGAAA